MRERRGKRRGMTTLPSNNHYNKNLKSFAREHRNEGTRAEIRLWKEVLSRKQMLGFQFLRQRPIDRFIADFFCKELKLVIEVDGYTHHFEETHEKDLIKERRLLELGYTTIRFKDEEVLNEIERVKEIIVWKIEDLRINRPPFPPSPPKINTQGGIVEFNAKFELRKQ